MMSTRSETNYSFDEFDGANSNDNHPQDTQSYSYAMLEKELMAEGLMPFFDGNPDQFTSEMRGLQSSNKQLKIDLQTEQDNVLQMRKKINNVEKQKLESETRSNAEIAGLETQVAKLRSQMEKGEATRHNLEYELTVSQRELNNLKQNSVDKATVFKDATEDMKQKIGELSDEVKRLQQSLQSCKENADDNEQKSRRIIQELEHQLSKTRVDLDTTSNEKNRLNDLCQKHSNLISELSEKLQVFENDKRYVLENLKKATAELEYAKEREERMKSEIEGAMARVKTLEENIEIERASHLETKFNSEIVQLRVRDLDGAIDVEKSANTEANKAIERLTQQNRELEQVYDQERKTRKDLNSKMDKMEKEYMSVRRQMTSEVEDKKSVIGNLSKELESHQKNFNELKTELSKAKKRQMFLEETYGGSIKELEFLLHTFHFDDKKLRMAIRKEEPSVSGGAAKGKKPLNPSVTVESFKQMLIHLKKRLDSQNEELMKAKKNIEKLSKDLDSSKEMVKNKDRTIEDTQKNYTKTAKDLNKARANYAELESTIGKLKASLQTNTTNQNKDRTRIQELSEEIMKLVKRHRADEEEKIAFLHSLYQKLLSGHIIIPTKDRGFNQFSWLDLTEVVFEQVSALIDMVHTSGEKLKHTYSSSKSREVQFASLKEEHEDQITKLTNMARERDSAWQRQKEELEKHYNEMITDLQSQSKKSQAIAEQAWEKVRATGSVQQGLETEVIELRRELAESQVQASSLLSACALLSGALYPLYSKASMLSSQRHILEDLLCNWENCRDRAIYLTSVLSSGRDSDQDQPERDNRFQQRRSPILRFRMGVIAVMAANRLSFLGAGCKKCFVTYNSTINQNGLAVSTGGLPSEKQKLTAVNLSICSEPSDNISSGFGPFSLAEKRLGSWLTSSELLETVMASMTELQESLRINKNQDNPTEVKLVLNAARTSFTKYIDRLALFFPTSSLPIHSSVRDRSSLLRKLERPLSHLLKNLPPNSKGSVISSQDVMSSLQNHILDLTQRLHSAEKERRHLLADLNNLKQQIGDENAWEQTSIDKHSSSKGAKYVAMDKFEKVCVELSGALRREQKAQVLLQEQSNQLTELTSRLDMCASDGVHKEKNLVQVQEGMTEMQGQLRHKDQNLRQIGKQLAHIEYERDSLQSNLKDAESALRTAARDKEIVAQYIKSVGSALESAKKQFLIISEPPPLSKDISLSRLLLDADLIPLDIGRAGPELIALQNLVGGFVDAQHQAVNKIRSLEEEIASHRSHIESLKKELSNAVQREFSQQLASATDGAFSEFTDQEDLVPLKEDQDISFESLPTPRKMTPPISTTLSHPSIQHKKSAFHSVKSSSPHSPRKSPRPSK